MIKHDKAGGRTIELFIPFDLGGKRYDSITLKPLRLGHVLSWNDGAWKNMIELLVDLAGVEESVIRELRYPDADRVMEAFMAILTVEIRNDIANGRIPMKATPEMLAVAAREANAPTNGSGEAIDPAMMQGPGAPLPEAGFDMGEEP